MSKAICERRPAAQSARKGVLALAVLLSTLCPTAGGAQSLNDRGWSDRLDGIGTLRQQLYDYRGLDLRGGGGGGGAWGGTGIDTTRTPPSDGTAQDTIIYVPGAFGPGHDPALGPFIGTGGQPGISGPQVPLPRVGGNGAPPSLGPLPSNRMEVSPGRGGGGIAGADGDTGAYGSAHASGADVSWSDVADAVLSSDLPDDVKARLLSDRARDFFHRCTGPAGKVGTLRRHGLSAGRDTIYEIYEAASPTQRDAIAAALADYVSNCLERQPDGIDASLQLFAKTRVGVLRNPNGQIYCTATLVSARFILTARHCVAAATDPDENTVQTFFDLERVTFERSGYGGLRQAVNLTWETVRSPLYAVNPTVAYFAGTPRDDYVLIKLAAAMDAHVQLPWSRVRISVPDRYDDLAIVSFNSLDALVRRHGAERRRQPWPHWTDSVLWDTSVPCLVAGTMPTGVTLHACQSEGAGSGAPLISATSRNGDVHIHGVHGGTFSIGARQAAIWNQLRLDSRLVPNFGNVVRDPVLSRIYAAVGQ